MLGQMNARKNMRQQIPNRTLFTGDNLDVMRGINSGSVDLVYLDPPFNSKRTYAAPIGSEAAGAGFKDAWTMEDTKEEWLGMIAEKHGALEQVIQAAGVAGHKTNKAYLVYMAIRLLEIHRIVKSSGAVYFHCDPTMSHSIKLVMDAIFGAKNFCNEIIWCYSTSGRAAAGKRKTWAGKHDVLLSYAKRMDQLKADCTLPCSDEYIKSHYRQTDGQGRKCRIRMDAGKRRVYYPGDGMNGNDWWEIPYVNSRARERTGYPTQKPLELLKRIVGAGGEKNGIVLDPFCGCATTLIAADILERQWWGIDISPRAVDLVNLRLPREAAVATGKQGTLTGRKAITRTDIPRRTDKGAVKPSANIRHMLYGRQQGDCNGCETHFEFRHLTKDHAIPLSRGGTDTDDNLQLLCGHCNSLKGNGTMEELKARLRKLGVLRDSRR